MIMKTEESAPLKLLLGDLVGTTVGPASHHEGRLLWDQVAATTASSDSAIAMAPNAHRLDAPHRSYYPNSSTPAA
jgi:hypothetical protein